MITEFSDVSHIDDVETMRLALQKIIDDDVQCKSIILSLRRYKNLISAVGLMDNVVLAYDMSACEEVGLGVSQARIEYTAKDGSIKGITVHGLDPKYFDVYKEQHEAIKEHIKTITDDTMYLLP